MTASPADSISPAPQQRAGQVREQRATSGLPIPSARAQDSDSRPRPFSSTSPPFAAAHMDTAAPGIDEDVLGVPQVSTLVETLMSSLPFRFLRSRRAVRPDSPRWPLRSRARSSLRIARTADGFAQGNAGEQKRLRGLVAARMQPLGSRRSYGEGYGCQSGPHRGLPLFCPEGKTLGAEDLEILYADKGEHRPQIPLLEIVGLKGHSWRVERHRI
jgi:hypothetical protein